MLLLLATLLSAPAVADDDATDEEPPAREKLFAKHGRRDQDLLALTISGGLASSVVVELGAELNLPRKHAVQVQAGVGAWQAFGQGPFEQLFVTVGGQYRYSVLGDFQRGLYVGFEAASRLLVRQVGVPWELGLSPVVGFKYTAPIGLVVDVNAGPSLVLGNFGAPRAGATVGVGVGYAFGVKPYR